MGFQQPGDVEIDNATIGSALSYGPATVCFVGIENSGAEELVDFKDQQVNEKTG